MPLDHMETPSSSHVLFSIWYGGILVATVGYVVFLILTIFSLKYLWRARASARSFGRWIMVPYTITLMIIGTLAMILDIWGSQFALLAAAMGKSASQTATCSPSQVLGGVLHQVPLLLSDAFLIYRTFVILGQGRRRFGILGLPLLLYMASFILAIMSDALCASPIFDTKSINIPSERLPIAFAIAFYSTSVIMNVVLTLMIIVKLNISRSALRKYGVIANRTSSISGMLAESASLYTVAGLLFVITMLANSDFQIFFGQLFGVSAFLSSSIITFRIALGIESSPPRNNLPANESVEHIRGDGIELK